MVSIKNALSSASQLLKSRKIDSARTDAVLLMCHTLQCDKTRLTINRDRILSKEEYEQYRSYIELRSRHTPIQYLTNSCEFMGLYFYVTKGVFIPRPETELLTEALLSYFHEDSEIKILDLCCGSGCIGISLCHFLRKACAHLIDISDDALEIAEYNIRKHGFTDRISYEKMDILSARKQEKYDIIVSNPPYINEEDFILLDATVKEFEPTIALLAEGNEYKFYEKITDDYKTQINPGGILAFETGYNQALHIKLYIDDSIPFSKTRIIKDLSNIDRVVIAQIT